MYRTAITVFTSNSFNVVVLRNRLIALKRKETLNSTRFYFTFHPLGLLPGLCHILVCVCVCPGPSGTAMTEVAGSRETVQSEMCRSPFPVPNGKHSPGSPTKDVWGSAQSPQRSLFTPDTQVKRNDGDVFFRMKKRKRKRHDTKTDRRPVFVFCESVCGPGGSSQAPTLRFKPPTILLRKIRRRTEKWKFQVHIEWTVNHIIWVQHVHYALMKVNWQKSEEFLPRCSLTSRARQHKHSHSRPPGGQRRECRMFTLPGAQRSKLIQRLTFIQRPSLGARPPLFGDLAPGW